MRPPGNENLEQTHSMLSLPLLATTTKNSEGNFQDRRLCEAREKPDWLGTWGGEVPQVISLHKQVLGSPSACPPTQKCPQAQTKRSPTKTLLLMAKVMEKGWQAEQTFSSTCPTPANMRKTAWPSGASIPFKSYALGATSHPVVVPPPPLETVGQADLIG